MTKTFTPLKSDAHPIKTGPKTTFDIAWLAENGDVEWSTRTIPSSSAIDYACASISSGALVDTNMGPVAIEDLTPGDMIRTVSGEHIELRWIGARSYPELSSLQMEAPFYRVSIGTFGHKSPARDTIVSARTALYVEHDSCRPIVGQTKAFAPIGGLEDGINISAVRPMGEITLYNLAFDNQDAFYVNGMPVESFHPSRNAMQMLTESTLKDMARLFPFLNDGSGFGKQLAPRLTRTEAQSLAFL